MIANGKWGLVAVGMLVMAAAVPAAESGVPQALPEGVTEAMVEEGRTLFASDACASPATRPGRESRTWDPT